MSRVQNVHPEEYIVWEGESDSESDDVSTEMNDKALAPEELLVGGSRFSQVRDGWIVSRWLRRGVAV